ncbi:hypothetical protein B0H13DRAFT_1964043 [Mycena leptocephala]|nr:hypothetical protein B0H13DRAFT_1964043 [Mycena leptocephala]
MMMMMILLFSDKPACLLFFYTHGCVCALTNLCNFLVGISQSITTATNAPGYFRRLPRRLSDRRKLCCCETTGGRRLMCNILLCNYSCGGPAQDRMDSIASWFPFHNQDQE